MHIMLRGTTERSVSAEVLAIGEAIEVRHQAGILAEALDQNNLPLACEAAGDMLGIPPRNELFNRDNGMPHGTIADRFIYDKSPSNPDFAKVEAEEFAFGRRPHPSPEATAATYLSHMSNLASDAVNVRFNPQGAHYARELAVRFADDKRLFQAREGVKKVGLMEFVDSDRLHLHTPYSEFDAGRGLVGGLVASVSFDHNKRKEVRAYFESRGFMVDPSEPPVITKLRTVYTDERLKGRESLKEHLGFTDEQMAAETENTIVLPLARTVIEATIVAPIERRAKPETKIMPKPLQAPTQRLALGSLVTADATPGEAETRATSLLSDESVEVQLAVLKLNADTPPPSEMEVVQTLREALTLNERRLQLLFSPAEMSAVKSYLEGETQGRHMSIAGLGRIAEQALRMAYDHVNDPDHEDASKRLASLDALKHLRKSK